MGGCSNCGKIGQVCCGGGIGCTAARTRCLNNMCESCGGFDERCCDNKFCGEGFACDMNDRCRRCGDVGQPCCAGGLCAGGRTCNSSSLCQ